MDYVHRKNLIPDPRFQHVGDMRDQGLSSAQAVDHENGRRYVRAIYDGSAVDPYLDIAQIRTSPGDYRLFFNVFAQGGSGLVRVYTRPAGSSSYAIVYERGVANGQTLRETSGTFALQDETIVRIVPPKTGGGLTMITETNLELASTFDEAFPYFDGSMNNPFGGGGIRSSLLAACAVRSFWGLAA